jgi:putative methionine-R-sulfoxide reductase with GAF domain
MEIRRFFVIEHGNRKADPRYLTTFGSTNSEIIVPIKHSENGQVLGTVDVESELLHAFSTEDRALLETCAHVLTALFDY